MLGDDENSLPACCKASNAHRNQKTPLAVKVFAGSSLSIASSDNVCSGILAPQRRVGDLLRQLTVVRHQLYEERQTTESLQAELQGVQDQLLNLQAQLQQASTKEADLTQQLSAANKQLQRARQSAEASESARMKAAVDCNHSAGIALRRLKEVQQLRQVVQQQAEHTATMQQALTSVNAQLTYSRQLHAHTAALLSMRDMQLAHATQQHSTVLASASTSPTAQQCAQQHEVATEEALAQTAVCSQCQVITSHACSITASAEGHEDCCDSECSVVPNKSECDEADEGTGTPIAHHPARPDFYIREYKGSRLSLVDDFDRAAAANTQQPAVGITAPCFESGQPIKQPAELFAKDGTDSSDSGISDTLGKDSSRVNDRKGFKMMMKCKTASVLQALRSTGGLRQRSL